jgi:toxin ParE1/3/4
MKVHYTPEALADLAAIYDYLDERTPRAALRTKAVLQKVIAGLTDFPDMGPATDIEDVRVLLAGRLPYRVFYRHVGEEFTSCTSDIRVAVRGRTRKVLSGTRARAR